MNTIQESPQSLNPELESLPYLRKCRICGLKVRKQEDLELFKSKKKAPYKHDTICKECFNESVKGACNKEFIKYFGVPLICHFCKEEVSKLYGRESDSLVFHSLDGNHDNMDTENKTPTHSRCHTIFHHTGKICTPETRMRFIKANLGSKNPNWKGDAASDNAKYARKWRRKRRESQMVQEAI